MSNIFKIAISAGHDMERKGAVNTSGEHEWDVMSRVLDSVFESGGTLTSDGCIVYPFKLGPDRPLQQLHFKRFERPALPGATNAARIKALTDQINEWGAYGAIDLHFDSQKPGVPPTSGTFGLWYDRDGWGDELAQSLTESVAMSIGTRGRSGWKAPELGFLRGTRCDACVFETHNGALGMDVAKFTEAAKGGRGSLFWASLVNGVMRWVGLREKERIDGAAFGDRGEG